MERGSASRSFLRTHGVKRLVDWGPSSLSSEASKAILLLYLQSTHGLHLCAPRWQTVIHGDAAPEKAEAAASP
jgi:hypothetical protein